jgi:hypothetical protein
LPQGRQVELSVQHASPLQQMAPLNPHSLPSIAQQLPFSQPPLQQSAGSRQSQVFA